MFADGFVAQGDPYWRQFERNKPLTRAISLGSRMLSPVRWRIPGAGYTHPHKYPLILSDIFVYPDLREIHYDRESVDQPVIRSRDAVTYILNNGHVIIIAEEKAGKTTLMKSLIKDLQQNGKVAVALDGESLRNCLDGALLRGAIDKKLDEEFGKGHASKFWQLKSTQRAVVVDDFHKMGGNRRGKGQVAGLLHKHSAS